MKLLDSIAKGNLWPLYEGCISGDQLLAGKTLVELQREYAPSDSNVSLYSNAWIETLVEHKTAGVLVNESGDILGYINDKGEEALIASDRSRLIMHPWDLIYVNEQVVGDLTSSDYHGDVSSAAHVEGVLHVGKGTRILPGVFIEGNVVIGENCKVGPNCYIRGNTTIGDNCHIGQAVEIKNSIIGHGSAVGHLSYVGDSCNLPRQKAWAWNFNAAKPRCFEGFNRIILIRKNLTIT